MPNHPTNRPDEQTYLKQLLRNPDYKAPTQPDIAKYFDGLKNIDTEFRYNALPNNLLDHYFNSHRETADGYIIDLTSSCTNLPPHIPALEASSYASTIKDRELHGRLNGLIAEAENMATAGRKLERIAHQLFQLPPDELGKTNPFQLLNILGNVLTSATPEAIKIAKKAYNKQGLTLHPVIEDYITHRSEETYLTNLPREKDGKRNLIESTANFIILLCNATTTELETKFKSLRQQIEEERERIPAGEELIQLARETTDKTLKPAVIKMMGQLQGVKPSEIKPSNICLCGGSSMHIMEAALKTLVPKPKSRLFSKEKKKLLQFSMSWDGLKTIASDTNMDLSLIEGSINAQALDHHIRAEILHGKYADNPSKAKAKVREAIGALIMNIPENPIGKVPSNEEMQALAKVIEKYDLPVVVVDEIFSTPGYRSLVTYPGMADHCYVISGISKNMNTTNKLAFGYSPNDAFARSVNSELDKDGVLHPIAAAGFGAMLDNIPLSYFEGNQQEYKRKRQLVSKAMGNINHDLKLKQGIGWLEEPNYGCLGVVSLPREMTDACGIKNSCQLAEYIYKFSGVTTVPIGDVSQNPSQPLGVRINFSEEDHTLIEAMGRIGVAVHYMKRKKPYEEIEGEKYRGEAVRGNAEGMSGAMDAIADVLGQLFGGRVEYRGGGYEGR